MTERTFQGLRWGGMLAVIVLTIVCLAALAG